MAHLPPTGLGKRTRAEEALRGVSLRGKRAVVTGANSGIGTETTRVLALAGADVVMAVRNVAEGERVAASLRAALPQGSGALSVRALDLTDFASVRASAEGLLAEGGPLHLLVNNAGIMATPLGFTKQGFEQQLGVNHLGHFLFTTLLLPRLASTPGARVVCLSSAAHYQGKGASVLATLETDRRYEKRRYGRWQAYGDSKLANVLMAKGLARRLPQGAMAFALHPGVIRTNLGRHLNFSGALAMLLARPFMKSIPQGAATSVFAATAPELAGHSGAYLSDCNEKAPNRDAKDEALVERVWQLSERAVAGA
jgi:NAD(P)-dependent dehydrogenase (short-subunit alcohol dehydrogenase family)